MKIAVLALCGVAAAVAQEGIGWIDNYQEALKRARATGKPIFLEFRCEA
jgi:hypothetical protein